MNHQRTLPNTPLRGNGVRALWFNSGALGPACPERRRYSLCMKPLALTWALLLSILSACAGEKLTPLVVELPRPNSGAFSFAQAEARKSAILSNVPTPKLKHWKNLYMGFCIHIGKNDSLTVYGHFLKALPEYGKLRIKQSIADIKRLTDELPLEGNPGGVLITSKAIQAVLKVQFVPSVQLFYARSSEREPADSLRHKSNVTDG